MLYLQGMGMIMFQLYGFYQKLQWSLRLWVSGKPKTANLKVELLNMKTPHGPFDADPCSKTRQELKSKSCQNAPSLSTDALSRFGILADVRI